MPVIRKIEISNFRGIQKFSWCPRPGVNCLVGAGDSGKSSILDAIDLCLGPRRNLSVSDADFHLLNVETPIHIDTTLGELGDKLKSLDTYGLYLRGFDSTTGEISDEPEVGLETVLTVRLAVEADLEPTWSLLSERALAEGQSRNLSWNDRVRLAPTRLGAFSEYNLGCVEIPF